MHFGTIATWFPFEAVKAKFDLKSDVSQVLLGVQRLGRSLTLEPGDQLYRSEVNGEKRFSTNKFVIMKAPGTVWIVEATSRGRGRVFRSAIIRVILKLLKNHGAFQRSNLLDLIVLNTAIFETETFGTLVV